MEYKSKFKASDIHAIDNDRDIVPKFIFIERCAVCGGERYPNTPVGMDRGVGGGVCSV